MVRMAYRRNPLTTDELQRQARERVQGLGVAQAAAMSQPELQHLLEELEIHQIELELQNEHLNLARSQLESALSQSSELYDFSPVGSLSLDASGTITKLNLSAARLLGAERTRLLGSKLALYVSEADRPVFSALMQRASNSGDVQGAEVTLMSMELLVQYVNMRVAPLLPDRGWHVVLVDINERRVHEAQLRSSEERWKLALEASGDGVWDWNVQSGEVVYSKRYEQLYGFAEHEYGKRVEDWRSRVHPDDVVRVTAEMQSLLNGQEPSYASEYRGRCKDGSWKWVLARGAVVSRTPEGQPLRMVGTHVDITSRKHAEQALIEANAFQQAVFDSLDAQIAVLDRNASIVQINSAWRKYALASGHADSADFLGRNYLDVLSSITGNDPQTLLAAKAGIDAVCSGATAGFKLEQPFYAPLDNFWFSMKVTAVGQARERIVVSHENVSDLKASELASLLLANTDALTGALSRRNFLNLAELELARSRRYALPLMVLMLDLDHFKTINDRFGHAAGDAVLQGFVRTVRSVLRESDLIGRLGGEEFAVLLPNTNLDGGRALGQRIIDSVRADPAFAGDQRIVYTVSAGGAGLTGQYAFSSLLNLADAAMYRAKARGRDCLEMAPDTTPHQAHDPDRGDGLPLPT
jgi:diguanylate cyclase (GGDEF)-like protein/PAS domain S-box-containing protein